MSNYLGCDNVIKSASPKNETTLFGPNKIMDNQFQTIGKHFRNNLEIDIIKRDGSKTSNRNKIGFFLELKQHRFYPKSGEDGKS